MIHLEYFETFEAVFFSNTFRSDTYLGQRQTSVTEFL